MLDRGRKIPEGLKGLESRVGCNSNRVKLDGKLEKLNELDGFC